MRPLVSILAFAFLGGGTCWAAECKDAFIRMITELGPLDGYEAPKGEVYPDGFKIRLVLSVADPKVPSVTVSSIHLDHKFSPGRQAAFAQPKGDVYGKGPATPRVFSVLLRGAEAEPALWTTKNSGVEATSANFLDTPDPQFKPFQLRPSAKEEFIGTVLAARTGVYDVKLRVGYQSGRGSGECYTPPIRLYQNDDR